MAQHRLDSLKRLDAADARNSAPPVRADSAAAPPAPSAAIGDRPAAAPRARTLGEALLRPSSVALIGASNDLGTPAGRAYQLFRSHAFRGAAYPVNAWHRQVQGMRAWPDLAALPGPVDQALILVAGDAAAVAIEACGRAQVPLATLLVTDEDLPPENRDRRMLRLVDIAHRHNVRLIGPDSAGLVVPRADLALTGDSAFWPGPLVAGRLLLLAQSGSALGTLYSRGVAREVNFAAMISAGAEADLSIGEIGAAALDDPEIDAAIVFLETLRHGADFSRFAEKAHREGKPIIVCKLGRARGGVGGSGDAADAFFRAHGVVRVDQFETLLELAPMLVRRRPGGGRAAAVVSVAAGGGPLIADRLQRRGVAVQGLDDLARERLLAAGVPIKPGPVAEAAGIAGRPEAIGAVLNEALDAPNNDVVLAAIGAEAALHPERAVQPVIAAAQRADKPVAALLLAEAPEALALLGRAGVAAFRTPESAADGLAAYLDWVAPFAPALPAEVRNAPPPQAGHGLHEGQGLQIVRMLGIPVPTMLWVNRDAPIPAALPFPPPYVVKVLSPDIPHRREVGGIALGLETLTAVQLAADAIIGRIVTSCPEAYLDGVLIQRMEKGLLDVRIAYRRDAEVGPIVTLSPSDSLDASGRDRVVRLAPLDRAQAYAMIDEAAGLAPIRGFRNRPRGDLDALAQAIVAMSSLALLAAPRIVSAELDPLLVKPEGEGVVAIHATFRTE